MKPLNNNNGIALITALMFTLLILALILGVLSMVNQGTKTTSSMKVYRNTTEAAYGGAEIVMQDVLPRLFTNISTYRIAADYSKTSFNTMAFGDLMCLRQKKSSENTGTNWSACGDKSINSKLSPDMTFKLVGTNGQSFTVYSKIVDTIQGVTYPDNSVDDSGKVLSFLGGGVTSGRGGSGMGDGTSLLQRYVYRIEVSSEKTNVANKENSKISVLYEY